MSPSPAPTQPVPQVLDVPQGYASAGGLSFSPLIHPSALHKHAERDLWDIPLLESRQFPNELLSSPVLLNAVSVMVIDTAPFSSSHIDI